MLTSSFAAFAVLWGVASGTSGADGETTPTLVPTTPKSGPNGPRIVQPWTGTQLNLREDWTAEMLRPAPDLYAATPGQTWEALRITSPLGQRTCSLYVAVTEDGQPSLDHASARIKPRDIAEPSWDLSAGRPTLLYPDPAQRLAPTEAWTDDDWDASTRYCNPGMEHEVLQVWACAEAVDTEEARGYGPYGIGSVIVREPVPGEVWGTTGPAGEMLQPRSDFTATLLPDGRVLVVGGRYDRPLASAEVWDPEDRTFTPAGQMKHRRMNHTAVPQPDGRVLIVGGTGGYGQDPSRTPNSRNPTTSTFTSVPGLRVARKGSASVLGFPDGRTLVLGGTTVSDGRQAWLAEIWEPASGAFEPAGKMPGARNGSRVFALPNGDAVVTGPGHREWLRWDAAERAFEPIGQTSQRRDETFQLAGGRLLAVGVNDEQTCKKGMAYASTPDAEVWLPGQGVFRTGGAFKAPRYG